MIYIRGRPLRAYSAINQDSCFKSAQSCLISIGKGRTHEEKLLVFWSTCTTFFRRQNSRCESQFRTKNTIYTVYMQPKKQLKVQYIGIFEEIDSFY